MSLATLGDTTEQPCQQRLMDFCVTLGAWDGWLFGFFLSLLNTLMRRGGWFIDGLDWRERILALANSNARFVQYVL
ncbi:MAG: hypothetical protein R3C53_20795 [Pirellulaceae bacterium]